MICPICKRKSTIVDLVHYAKNNDIYRKRMCTKGHVFYTKETEVKDGPGFRSTWKRGFQ